MNADTANNRSASPSLIIKPWLGAGLVAALAANVLLSAILIVELGRFDESKRQAEETEARVAKQRGESAKLQVEVETLTKQKEALAATVADWQQRLKEKSAAEAILATLDAKQRQAESDIAQVGKRLEDANRALLDANKQKAELATGIERLKSERDALAKSTTDAKALARQAEEAERRLAVATNALATAETRRKQLETDASAAQTRFEQIQKEADDLRQLREKLNTDLAALRQQVQGQKDLLATFDQKAAELKALQTAAAQEGQKAAKLQQESATAEARAGEMEARFAKAARELSQLTNRLAQAREDATDAETRRDAAKGDQQKADADLAASRAQLQVFVVRQGELTRETSRLEATIERLKTEKNALEKENGRQEAQSKNSSTEGQNDGLDLKGN